MATTSKKRVAAPADAVSAIEGAAVTFEKITATSWRHLDTIKSSLYKALNLTSGTRNWFRVRAIGSRDVKGPWSDPAVKMAT